MELMLVFLGLGLAFSWQVAGWFFLIVGFLGVIIKIHEVFK